MEPRAVWAASDNSARSRSAIAPAARKRPLPAAEIDGVEVSWRFRTEMLTTMPASSAVDRRGDSRRRRRCRYRRDFARVILHFDPRAPRCKQRARAKRLSGRGEGLSLLHDIGDENDGLGVARLAARMGGFGRYLEAIAFFDRAGRLPLDGKLEAAFHDISGFDSRMRVSGDGNARLYRRFHEQRRIARRRTVRLRQNLARDAACCRGWRALSRRFGRNELRNSADRARRKACESSSREHHILPACVRIISAVRTDVDRKSFTIGLARRSWHARSPLPRGSTVAFVGAAPSRARDAKARRASDFRNQPTTSAACRLWPSLMPRAFIQS